MEQERATNVWGVNYTTFCLQELDDPLILIHEKKITSINAVVKVLELALKVTDCSLRKLLIPKQFSSDV